MTDNEAYLFPSTESETQRLERQGTLLYGGVSFLEPFLSGDLREVLDVGCGSGYFTRQVAAAIPLATVTGLDIDESRLSFARSQPSVGKLHYRLADMAAMPFPGGCFDLAFCRFALVHKPGPTSALSEMARVTRSGGQVVAYDMIHDGIWFVPERPAFAKVLRAIVEVLRERGAEPNQGLFLAAGMRRVGLTDISIRVIPHHTLAHQELYEAYRDNWIATVTSLAEKLGPRLDEELVQTALAELDRVSGDELLVETTVLAWARKP